MFSLTTLKLIWHWIGENGRGLALAAGLLFVIVGLTGYWTLLRDSPVHQVDEVEATIVSFSARTGDARSAVVRGYQYLVRFDNGGTGLVTDALAHPKAIGQLVRLERTRLKNGFVSYRIVDS